PDDRRLAVCCNRGTDEDEYVGAVWLWDVRRARRELVIPLGNLHARHVALAEGGLLAVAGALDLRGPGQLRLFDTASGGEIARLQLPGVRWIEHLLFSPDGKRLALGCQSGVRVWSVHRPGINTPARGSKR